MISINSKHCLIETFQEKHIAEAKPLFTDLQVREFLGGPVPEEMVEKRLRHWLEDDNTYFAVLCQEDGALVGVVDITPYHEPGLLELSYLFLPQYWGEGFATESIEAVLRYCKEELHMTKIVSETQKKNERSCRLLERLGYLPQKEIVRFGAEQIVFMKML